MVLSAYKVYLPSSKGQRRHRYSVYMLAIQKEKIFVISSLPGNNQSLFCNTAVLRRVRGTEVSSAPQVPPFPAVTCWCQGQALVPVAVLSRATGQVGHNTSKATAVVPKSKPRVRQCFIRGISVQPKQVQGLTVNVKLVFKNKKKKPKICLNFKLNLKSHLETANNLPDQNVQDSALYYHARYKHQRALHLKPKVTSFYLTSIDIFSLLRSLLLHSEVWHYFQC